MTSPLSIVFPNATPSPWVTADIEARMTRLERVCPQLQSARVVVDIPHRHHAQGNRFVVRIDLMVPGQEIAVSRDANLHAAVKDGEDGEWTKRYDVEGARRDIRVVLRDAFAAARRRLRDHDGRQDAGRRRGVRVE